MRMVITDRLSFGNESDCTHTADGSIAVVHACKHPCHRHAVGYTNTLPNTHPSYLVLERGHHLYLNLIDPPAPLFMMPSFEAFLRFVDREIAERPILIHCNQGESRAPSLTLLYMAKRLGLLPADTYSVAAEAFRQKYPYNPGRGIQSWLTTNWSKIN
ncbi:MAG: hypothetical protein M3O30_15830 [Planctomycetota bacterium]|jgi:predicted protein tyrosine phosphatase|nr:hypothetical protein [Planctomycetota bacterium]